MATSLPSPQLLQITGADAVAFAQSQFSSDLQALSSGHWQWSAWLSAQGRVRAFFQLLRPAENDLRLILRGNSAEQLRDALAPYVFRSKVQLRVVNDQVVSILDQPPGTQRTAADERGFQIHVSNLGMSVALPGKSPRWLLLGDADAAHVSAEDPEAAANANALDDIDAGLVTLTAATEDRLLPGWIGLTNLGATSVRKGCYPGQEIVARLHFKGGNKRWLHHLTFDAAELPVAGASIGVERNADEQTGIVLNAAWVGPGLGAALAVLPEIAGDARALWTDRPLITRSLSKIQPSAFAEVFSS